jgi:hypothetical protein
VYKVNGTDVNISCKQLRDSDPTLISQLITLTPIHLQSLCDKSLVIVQQYLSHFFSETVPRSLCELCTLLRTMLTKVGAFTLEISSELAELLHVFLCKKTSDALLDFESEIIFPTLSLWLCHSNIAPREQTALIVLFMYYIVNRGGRKLTESISLLYK